MQSNVEAHSFYGRRLPVPPALATFDSRDGQALFSEGLRAGTMNSFFSLVQQFRTQEEPAYCGLSTLVMVLNTLCVDPKQTWKGVWRWYHEDMLNCCAKIDLIKEAGINIFEFKCLAICNGLNAEVFVNSFAKDSLPAFRRVVKECSEFSSKQRVLVVSYSRQALGQTGDGHFSPIGGYCESEDALLLLDVARFKYPAHWIRVEDMWNAMQCHDATTRRPRGYMVFRAAPNTTGLLRLLHRGVWTGVRAFHARLQSREAQHLEKGFIELLPAELLKRVKTYEAESDANLPNVCPRKRESVLRTLFEEIVTLDIYRILQNQLGENPLDNWTFNATIVFLAFCRYLCPQHLESYRLSVLLGEEVRAISEQVAAIVSAKL